MFKVFRSHSAYTPSVVKLSFRQLPSIKQCCQMLECEVLLTSFHEPLHGVKFVCKTLSPLTFFKHLNLVSRRWRHCQDVISIIDLECESLIFMRKIYHSLCKSVYRLLLVIRIIFSWSYVMAAM